MPAVRDPDRIENPDIEALAALEATELPPESHLPAPPIPYAMRQVGEGRIGRWATWIFVAFMLVSLWQTIPH